MSASKFVYYQLVDTWAITKRNLLRYIRLPRLIFFSSVQPVMFLLLFNYVFGGALGHSIVIPGGKYINYLLPGIAVQMLMFGGMQTGIGLARDMVSGLTDRFKSLPMSRGAVLAGRTLSDTIRNIVVFIILFAVGYLLGFRLHHGLLNGLAMAGIVLAFGFAFSWVAASIGIFTKDEETAQLGAFVLIFPLVFASAAFVPIATMPGWLQAFARNQPISFATEAARSLAQGLPSDGSIWKCLVWVAAILIIFVPLSVLMYKKRS